jgi:hypothetical protein
MKLHAPLQIPGRATRDAPMHTWGHHVGGDGFIVDLAIHPWEYTTVLFYNPGATAPTTHKVSTPLKSPSSLETR